MTIWWCRRNASSAICFASSTDTGNATDLQIDDSVPELAAYLAATHVLFDNSNFDNMDKTLKAFALVVRDYTNGLLAGTYTNKTVNQIKADFLTKYNSLP